MKPYRVQVEVGPMDGTTLPADWAGAFVNVYLCAEEIVEAIERAESALLTDRYRPISTYAAWQVDLEELREEEAASEGSATTPTVRDLENLRVNGGVIYSGFVGYPPEERSLQ